MLNTALDTYNAFLDGVKKPNTDTVVPVVFNRLINDWGINEWLKANVSEEEGVDVSRKQIDDLQLLKIVTDSQIIYNGDVMYDIIPDAGGNYMFSKPDGITPLPNVSVPAITHNLVYPKYLRLTDVMFKINYVNNECHLTGVSEYQKAQPMRSGQRSIIMDNTYLKPKDDGLYYEVLNNKIRLITNTPSTGYSMQLEYLRYPATFYFDPNRYKKSCIAITSNSVGIGTIQVTLTTAMVYVYVSPVVNIALNDSKYVIAQNIYNAIVNDVACPLTISQYTTVTNNSVCIGQFGYDAVATIATTGVAIPTVITTNNTVSDVNIELPDQQRKEVVELAVRIYIERVTDTRYKSFLTEQAISEQAKK